LTRFFFLALLVRFAIVRGTAGSPLVAFEGLEPMAYKQNQLTLMGIAGELIRLSADLSIQARKDFKDSCQVKRVGLLIADIRALAEQAAQLDNEGL
jgi:hypothetical protein